MCDTISMFLVAHVHYPLRDFKACIHLGSSGSARIVRKLLESYRVFCASSRVQLSSMKNPPCQDPFVELITLLPLDLNYGLVEKSRRCLVQMRLGSFLERMQCRFRVKKTNDYPDQCERCGVTSVPVGCCSVLGGSPSILHKEARALGQLTVLNSLLD